MSALIIAVGHGMYTDPFTCSAGAQPGDDLSKVEDCLERIRADQFPSTNTDTVKTWIDEILVVENDDVIHHYSFEDGLGEAMTEDQVGQVDMDVPNFPDFQEQEDDSDSEDA